MVTFCPVFNVWFHFSELNAGILEYYSRFKSKHFVLF